MGHIWGKTNSPLRVSEEKPVENPREVAEVKDVVELGWRGRQFLHDVVIELQRAECQLVTHSLDALVKHLKNEKTPQMPVGG